MFLIQKYIIKGVSMSPGLKPGDRILASPLPYLFHKPHVNDLIVCYDPRDKRILVKRIIKIDKDVYTVAGDNPEKSIDSRLFGPIKKKDIIGKVIYKMPNI